MKVVTFTKKKYFPDTLDILKATNSNSLIEASKKLGVLDSTIQNWKNRGMTLNQIKKHTLLKDLLNEIEGE